MPKTSSNTDVFKRPGCKKYFKSRRFGIVFLCVQRTAFNKFEISEIMSKTPELYIPNAFKTLELLENHDFA